jgi:hypothetical protein
MTKYLLLLWLFVLPPMPATAGIGPTSAGWAVDIHTEISHEDFKPHMVILLEQWWSDSLSLLRKFPPKDFGPNLLEWNANTDVLRYKEVAALFMTEKGAAKMDKLTKMSPKASILITRFILIHLLAAKRRG